jgi:hypothetical protein
MPHVLGLPIGRAVKIYEGICREKAVDPQAVWTCSKRISLFQRYHWNDYANYFNAMTSHLYDLGIDPFEFQKRLTPKILTNLYLLRFGHKSFSPQDLLRSIDTFCGPYMFRAPESVFERIGSTDVRVHISLGADFTPAQAFFEHCKGGMDVALDLLNFRPSRVDLRALNGRELNIVYQFSTPCEISPKEKFDSDSSIREINEMIESLKKDMREFDGYRVIDHWYDSVQHLERSLELANKRTPQMIDLISIISSYGQMAWYADRGSDKFVGLIDAVITNLEELQTMVDR